MFPKLNLKRRQESDEVEEEVKPKKKKKDKEQEGKKPKVFVPVSKTASMPIIRAIDDEELTNEDVVAQIEEAINTASSFGKSVPTIRQHLKARDYGEAAITAKGALLATLVELIPVAESAVRQNAAQRGIYQFNSLVSQMRELMIDLEGERDVEGLITSIINEALDPQFRTMAQMLVQWNTGVKRSIRGELDPADFKLVSSIIDEQTQQLANYINQVSITMRQDIDRKVSRLE